MSDDIESKYRFNDDLNRMEEKWDKREAEGKKERRDIEGKEAERETQKISSRAVLEKFRSQLVEAGVRVSQFEVLIARGVAPETLELTIYENLATASKKTANAETEKARKRACNLIMEKYGTELNKRGISRASLLGLIQEWITPGQLEEMVERRVSEKEGEEKEKNEEDSRISNCLALLDSHSNKLQTAKVSRVMLESLVYFKKITPERLEKIIQEKLNLK